MQNAQYIHSYIHNILYLYFLLVSIPFENKLYTSSHKFTIFSYLLLTSKIHCAIIKRVKIKYCHTKLSERENEPNADGSLENLTKGECRRCKFINLSGKRTERTENTDVYIILYIVFCRCPFRASFLLLLQKIKISLGGKKKC